MRKIILSALLAFAGFTTNAQIADGSIAPDFTVTDVFGVTHSLSGYLAQGKTVIMDISATWCSPCWAYHNSGELEGLYYTLGQGGSGEVVILFVEADGQTDVDCLFGISPQNLTWGNWVEHCPYPVIDSALIGELYQIGYFPTIFRICPDGIVTELGQLNTEDLIADIAANCGTSQGIERNAHPQLPDLLVCSSGTTAAQATLVNYGSQPITTATLSVMQGETVIATQDFTVNIESSNSGTVTINPLEIGTGEGYTLKITAINGAPPQNTDTALTHFSVSEAPESNNNFTVKVNTDFFPGEMSWAIKNSAGAVVAQGGPYQPGTEGNFNGGGPDANTTKVHEVVLPAITTDCYSVELYDSFGDGWGQAPHGLEIWNGNEQIFWQEGAFYTERVVQPAFRTNGVLNGPVAEASYFSISPNPSKGIIYLNGIEVADVVITDMAGKVVFTASGVANGQALNLSVLQKGVYVAGITSNGTTITQKIVFN